MANNTSIKDGLGNLVPVASKQQTDGSQLAESLLYIANPAGTGDAVPANATNPLPIRLTDGVTSAQATVAAFHNGDNQTLPANSYGLNTGGVAQLLNLAGNLDRQRETGVDGISAVGISTGTAQNAQPFTTTHASTVAVNASAVFTPAAVAGFTSGAPWSIQVGSVLVLEPTPINGPVPANQEIVVVTATSSTTFTAKTAKTHTGSFGILGFVYNQSRDATVQDGAAGIGFAAAGTYLYNSQLNTGSGGWERERSAAGELDNASGFGTAVAAEYEWNGVAYDRARSLPAKAMNTGAASAAYAAGATTVVLNAAPTSLTPGEYLYFIDGTAGAITEAAVISSTYTPGSATVPLSIPLIASHLINAPITWESTSTNGPGLSGFFAAGIGIEEEAVYDPVTAKYYIERSSTQDAMPPQNVVAESGVVLNAGGTFERERAAYADGLGIVGIPAEAEMLWNGTAFDRARSASVGDGAAATGLGADQEYLFNGTTFDRARCDPNATGVQRSTTGGGSTAAIAAGATGNTVVKASAGRLARILLTSANGAAAVSVFDNATTTTGTVIGYIPASATAGTIVDFSMPATAGITVGGAASNPSMTISYY